MSLISGKGMLTLVPLIDSLLFQLADEIVDFGDGKKNEAVRMSQLIGGCGIAESLEQMHLNGHKVLCL